MISFTELRHQLGITQPALSRLVAAGLPHANNGKRKEFDAHTVARWLLDTGRAIPADSPDVDGPACAIARTRREVADHFGVNLRTVAEWIDDTTFPGRSGNRGRRDGYFPLDEIAEWIAVRDSLRRGGPRVDLSGHDLRDEMLSLKIQRERRRLEQEEGELAPIADMIGLVARQISTAKQILDSLPEKAARALPESLPRKTRAAITERIRREIVAIEELLSEAMEGDTDDA